MYNYRKFKIIEDNISSRFLNSWHRTQKNTHFSNKYNNFARIIDFTELSSPTPEFLFQRVLHKTKKKLKSVQSQIR